MRALLQKSCKDCTASSINTYYYNIKALATLAGHPDIPTHARWINALLQKVKKLPLMKTKNLTIAAIKALKAYGATKKIESWSKQMNDATERYAKQRNKQQRTDREAANWPTGGYAAIGKLADYRRKWRTSSRRRPPKSQCPSSGNLHAGSSSSFTPSTR